MSVVDAFVALGSNLGDRAATLQRGLENLREAAGISVLAASRVYETEAHTRPPHALQPAYLNAVVRIQTALSPAALLCRLLQIEALCGRARAERWAPRTLDLDLLVYGSRTLHTPALVLPHPHLHERRFVLQPLADLAAGWQLPHPYHETVDALLEACPDQTSVSLSPHQLAI